MKTTVNRPVEIEITHVRIEVAVRYDDEDIPYDFPLRDGDMWRGTVNIDTGEIKDWPIGASGRLSMKVCDEGSYYLLGPTGEVVGKRENNYVPHGVVPGEYGDYIKLEINDRGIITNWPVRINVGAFFGEDDED